MRHLILLLIVLNLLLLSGCASTTTEPTIHLSNLEPLPEDVSNDVIPLRVAVAAVISPRGTVESYQPLLDYMSTVLNRPVELVQRRTYEEVNVLIEQGQVDVAFVCTSAYIAGKNDFGMELLVAPQVNGEARYYSELIVPATSSAQSISDLEGKIFAFTDPISTTGRMYPTSLVNELGRQPDDFFARTFFTYSHDDAIQAVANGVADGAGVDSLVLDFAISRDPELNNKIRIIHRSPAFGIPPVVVNPNVRPQLKAELQELLLGLHQGDEGQPVLDAMGTDRFILIADSEYDAVRELAAMFKDQAR